LLLSLLSCDAMEGGSRYLTLRLCIFEATDGERTLTDELANRFVRLFEQSVWRAEVCQVIEPATGATKAPLHYEVSCAQHVHPPR
jgi:hypothetical protein